MSVAAQMPGGKRTEEWFLCACARRCMAPAAVAIAREHLAGEMDWNYLLSQAQHHAVLPLMNQNLRTHFPKMVPEPVLRFLDEASQHCQRRNLAFTGELLQILAIFEKQGIEAIPFKGPTLAIMAYGNISLRMFADLDILIRQKDFVRARKALLADGYVAKFTLTPNQERNYKKDECALQLDHPGRGTIVELHWLLTEQYLSIDLPIAEFWRRSSTSKIGQRNVKALAKEDLFLYLCVHGGKHQWERLEWLCGVAEVAAANPDMDCRAIATRAREWGIERMLNLALLLARDLLAMPLPEALRANAEADAIAARLAEQTAATLFSGKPRSADRGTNRGDLYLYLLRMRERWPDKLRILAYSSVRLPHPCSHELLRLPSKLAFLYYVLRPARLLSATLWAAFRYVAVRRKRIKNTNASTLAEGSVATF